MAPPGAESGSRWTVALTFPSTLVKTERKERSVRRLICFFVLICRMGRASCTTATVRRLGYLVKDWAYLLGLVWLLPVTVKATIVVGPIGGTPGARENIARVPSSIREPSASPPTGR